QLGKKFGLAEEELAELLPSGKQSIFSNRVHWAKTYLAQAKLLEITRRAYFRITQRGREVLATKPSHVDVKLLEKFPEFLAFKTRARASQKTTASPAEEVVAAVTVSPETPDEQLRNTIKEMEQSLSSELLQRILSAPPAFFESLIVTLLLAMGYGGSREGAG